MYVNPWLLCEFHSKRLMFIYGGSDITFFEEFVRISEMILNFLNNIYSLHYMFWKDLLHLNLQCTCVFYMPISILQCVWMYNNKSANVVVSVSYLIISVKKSSNNFKKYHYIVIAMQSISVSKGLSKYCENANT